MFETPVEKFTLVAFIAVSLAFAYYAGLFNAWLHPDPKPKISASNYPDFVVSKELNTEGLELTYNPALAIVSPDRTPFIDLILKIKNDRDVPRTLKLVFPDPATLLTDDPKFVVAQSIEKDENTGQTYHRVVLFIPAKSEKEVKVRYNNAYSALDELNTDIVFKLYNEDDDEIAEIPYKLRSVVLSFEDVWPYPTLPTSKSALEFYDFGTPVVSPNAVLARFSLWDSCVASGSSPSYYTYPVPSQFSKCAFVELNVSTPSAPRDAKYDVYGKYGADWVLLGSGSPGQTIHVFVTPPSAVKLSVSGYCVQSTGSGHTSYARLSVIRCDSYASAQMSYIEGNSTYTLARQEDGNIVSFQLPAQVSLVANAVNLVPVRLVWGSNTVDENLPAFYDPDKSHDLLWRMYDQWKSSIETNSAGGQ